MIMETTPCKLNESSISTNSTDTTCPMEYSSEIDDFTSLPFSPVFPDEDELSSRRKYNPSNDLIENVDESCDCKRIENESSQTISANHFQFSHCTIGESKGCTKKKAVNDTSQIELDDSSNNSTHFHSQHSHSTTAIRPLDQCSDCNKRNSNGQSPLSITSSTCFLKGMELLIEKGANVNILDAYGRSPLHLACEYNGNASSSSPSSSDGNYHHHHHDCVKLLLRKGANTNIRDAYGRTPLHIATKVGCVDCIQLLLDHGARTDVQDNEGNTALHIAASGGKLEIMLELSPTRFEDDRSSAEVVAPSLRFDDRDGLNSSYGRYNFGDDNVGASFYQSPRQNEVMERRSISKEVGDFGASFVTTRQDLWIGNDEAETIDNSHWFHGSNYATAGRYQSRSDLNESGYLTAKGSGAAWTKGKPFNRDSIKEEMDSIESSSSLSLHSDRFETESVESSVISLTDSNFDFMKMEVISTKSFLGHGMDLLFKMFLQLTTSVFGTSQHQLQTDKNGKYIFKEPPKHVAVAMEKMRGRNNLYQRRDDYR